MGAEPWRVIRVALARFFAEWDGADPGDPLLATAKALRDEVAASDRR
jgi:hypothetical protein